jgi:uncharacterized protein (TIGR00730 family)
MAKICVFLGYALTTDEILANHIRQLGLELAAEGHHLVMGGMSGGNMKLLGETFLDAGGTATIIYPDDFAVEAAHNHPNLTHVRTTDLSQRLQTMIATADAFITFPGGMGTIHEAAQVIADNQAGTYNSTPRKPKPQVIFNYRDYFLHLISQYQLAHEEGYIQPRHMELLKHTSRPQHILPMLEEALNG